ncbi:conserved Plasmodium protein, unknown function [Plasmodium reichenowi]|uniref:Uncharacterized protein n=10 Tax=Plasmodium (Laverania) TaxID=418107 RepID=C6KST0_PLAF7|nr:hypothetical protein PRSY57_0606800 [Plasmodium reichenowi]XP_966072.2 conserved Plasmodium protein, unknown function [Plasmodium falciparum 3D7]ETW44175.1 hypothetical protein PFNF135_01427 [Plasmodium falciparum NF135/5.C10]ETW62826.1 hypothetical protein PFMC_01346 [Plasmodium falciparum CAMP/Malaysia]EUR75586.1 hypothetical protein PFBG_01327 [Plasmodium falciparum 7G8]EWC77918.1 hypothetical protein C923_01413 [Plasmodium falciparum UGT5.1]EWC89804.1 hypothetical protein PFNF54_01383 |eukprot:XP_966072.2 conserved Plasmodium protein, unknown function [Plasmodium falciparum 3D7]
MKKIYKFSFELCRRIHFKSAKEWKQFMNPKIDGTRIKKIRNISENDMIHKHQILKYPYFKMKKIGKYNKIIKTSDLLFNRSIEIIYDYRYCEIFQKLKDLISFNLKGVVIKEKCTDDLTFEIYDCLQNKILIKKKNEEFRADDLFKEMFEKIKQNG